MEAYEQHLQQFDGGVTMKPVFQLARSVEPEKKRIVFAEVEEELVLRAVQIVVDKKIAKPILIGRPAVIARRLTKDCPQALQQRKRAEFSPRGRVIDLKRVYLRQFFDVDARQ